MTAQRVKQTGSDCKGSDNKKGFVLSEPSVPLSFPKAECAKKKRLLAHIYKDQGDPRRLDLPYLTKMMPLRLRAKLKEEDVFRSSA